MSVRIHELEHHMSSNSARKSNTEELLRASEEKRIELESRLAEDAKRHQEFKKNLQAKVELLKDEVIEKTRKYKEEQNIVNQMN